MPLGLKRGNQRLKKGALNGDPKNPFLEEKRRCSGAGVEPSSYQKPSLKSPEPIKPDRFPNVELSTQTVLPPPHPLPMQILEER